MALCFASCIKEVDILPDDPDSVPDNDSIVADISIPPVGAVGGLFSVAFDRQVYFSKGNLQWSKSGYYGQSEHDVQGGTAPGVWRFGEYQYSIVGSESQYSDMSHNTYFGNVSNGDNGYIGSSYSGWIDLFGWGTSGGYNHPPYQTSTYYADYGNGALDIAGTLFDWGVYNAISNGGDQPNRWRTLTRTEWGYLLRLRTNAGKKYGIGKIENICGLIILPDQWTLPEGCSFNSGISSSRNDYSLNEYSFQQWELMEANGAVFLPAAGLRYETMVMNVGVAGFYWTSSAAGSDAYLIYFGSDHLDVSEHYVRPYGCAVRLVHDK